MYKYDPLQYEFGVIYNGCGINYIHPIIINTWNVGSRLSTIDDYPMGDAQTSLKFGGTVFTKV